MSVNRVDIRIETEGRGADEVAIFVDCLCAGSPFVLRSVTETFTGEYNCSFEVKHHGLAVGFASVIELQHRLHSRFQIVSVDRLANLQTVPKLESAQ